MIDMNSTIEKVEQETIDSLITTKVKAKLAADDLLSAFEIKVKTENGNVALVGDVEDYLYIDHAIRLASEVDGVKKVRFKL